LLPADLYDPAAVEQLARQLADLNVEVLLNNAGVFLPGGISTEEPGHLERTLQLNLLAPYHLTRAVLPRMKARGHGTIVNLGSTAGLVGYPNGGSYCISKHALQGLSRALREELKPTGVRVVSVSPGATLTESWAGTDLPPERFMRPEDVAEAVWLACNLPVGTVVEEIVLRPQLGDLG
jgi:short-subunit dehydrogenase